MKHTAEDIRERLARGESKTDWAKVDALTDEGIEDSIVDDADWQGAQHIDWSQAKWAETPKKKAISIRLDDDIVAFFQATGKGYQTKINAVLRHFVTEQTRKND